MRDEYDMRLWTEHRSAMVGFAESIVDAVGYAMCRLRAVQWSAPWRAQSSRCL